MLCYFSTILVFVIWIWKSSVCSTCTPECCICPKGFHWTDISGTQYTHVIQRRSLQQWKSIPIAWKYHDPYWGTWKPKQGNTQLQSCKGSEPGNQPCRTTTRKTLVKGWALKPLLVSAGNNWNSFSPLTLIIQSCIFSKWDTVECLKEFGLKLPEISRTLLARLRGEYLHQYGELVWAVIGFTGEIVLSLSYEIATPTHSHGEGQEAMEQVRSQGPAPCQGRAIPQPKLCTILRNWAGTCK